MAGRDMILSARAAVHASVAATLSTIDAVATTGPLRTIQVLSPRERQALLLAAEGRTNGTIGRLMGISARTVEKHLQNTYLKLGVTNRTAAAAALHLGSDVQPGIAGEA